MKGTSIILSFPYRIFALGTLPKLSGSFSRHRYRVHSLFSARPALNTPLIPSVPGALWPDFSWAPSAPTQDQIFPPEGLSTHILPGFPFDALRVDAWGPNTSTEVKEFASRFIGWLRYKSMQPWIGAFDYHSEYIIKNEFAIDSQGRAIGPVYSTARATTANDEARSIDLSMWELAFYAATRGEQPPVEWLLYLDGVNAFAAEQIDECVLALTLALEVSRDRNFARFAPVKSSADGTVRLKAPFEDTDLLAHLSKRLKQFCNRDLSEEHPAEWAATQELYLCRHHVAHGKGAVFPTKAGKKKASVDNLQAWMASTKSVLRWLEAL